MWIRDLTIKCKTLGKTENLLNPGLNKEMLGLIPKVQLTKGEVDQF